MPRHQATATINTSASRDSSPIISHDLNVIIKQARPTHATSFLPPHPRIEPDWRTRPSSPTSCHQLGHQARSAPVNNAASKAPKASHQSMRSIHPPSSSPSPQLHPNPPTSTCAADWRGCARRWPSRTPAATKSTSGSRHAEGRSSTRRSNRPASRRQDAIVVHASRSAPRLGAGIVIGVRWRSGL
jgi:hypothetical protein